MAGRNGWVEDGRRRDRVRGAGVVRSFRMAIHPIDHQRMQINIQVGGGAETLDQGDGTGGGLRTRDAGLFEQKRGNHPMNDLQYRCEQFAMDSEQTS